MKPTLYSMKRLLYKAMIYVSPVMLINLSGKMLVTAILLSHVSLASFAQQKNVLLSRYDSCHVQVPQQTGFAIQAAGVAPMVRVAYVIPSNRTPQPNGVANLQHAIKLGQQFFREQMELNGARTCCFLQYGNGVPVCSVWR